MKSNVKLSHPERACEQRVVIYWGNIADES